MGRGIYNRMVLTYQECIIGIGSKAKPAVGAQNNFDHHNGSGGKHYIVCLIHDLNWSLDMSTQGSNGFGNGFSERGGSGNAVYVVNQ